MHLFLAVTRSGVPSLVPAGDSYCVCTHLFLCHIENQTFDSHMNGKQMAPVIVFPSAAAEGVIKSRSINNRLLAPKV